MRSYCNSKSYHTFEIMIYLIPFLSKYFNLKQNWFVWFLKVTVLRRLIQMTTTSYGHAIHRSRSSLFMKIYMNIKRSTILLMPLNWQEKIACVIMLGKCSKSLDNKILTFYLRHLSFLMSILNSKSSFNR